MRGEGTGGWEHAAPIRTRRSPEGEVVAIVMAGTLELSSPRG
jgi:hypothetical protein